MRNFALLFVPVFSLLFLFAGCATNSHDLVCQNNDPFYQEEEDSMTYREKTSLDEDAQLDPEQGNQYYSQSFLTDPPQKIAILPFENLEGGNFKLNWLPVTGRSKEKEETMSWTYANRLRKFFFAYMSLREFELMSLLETDTVLKELGITNPERLYSADPRDLAAALGVDALIYGKITHHRAHYYFLFSQVAVGLSVKCVSGQDGSDLFWLDEVKRDNKVSVAMNPIDMVASSVKNIFNLRGRYMTRAADEVCREIVSRIPVAESLIEERELYCKELVASNQRTQAIKEKMAIANGEDVDFLTDGGVEIAKADEALDIANITKLDENKEETLEEITEGVQLANADGVVRTVESASTLALIEKVLRETSVNAEAVDSFTYTASVPGLAIDDTLSGTQETIEIARADIIYDRDEGVAVNIEDGVIEIDASDIVYSNKGVVADIQTEATGNQNDEGVSESEMEDILNEIIEMMNISDIIYSSRDSVPDSPSEATS